MKALEVPTPAGLPIEKPNLFNVSEPRPAGDGGDGKVGEKRARIVLAQRKPGWQH